MEKYIKPDMEIVEIPNFAIGTETGSCPTETPEIDIKPIEG